MKLPLISSAWLLLLLTQFFMACTKFEGPQEIPAYIQIDSLTFTTDYSTEGTDNHNWMTSLSAALSCRPGSRYWMKENAKSR
jgi:hypothetical protein